MINNPSKFWPIPNQEPASPHTIHTHQYKRTFHSEIRIVRKHKCSTLTLRSVSVVAGRVRGVPLYLVVVVVQVLLSSGASN